LKKLRKEGGKSGRNNLSGDEKSWPVLLLRKTVQSNGDWGSIEEGEKARRRKGKGDWGKLGYKINQS